MNKKCIGCGVVLQNSNSDKLGYTPKEEITDNMYCERCYKINYYNQKYVTRLDNINEYILETVNKKADYVYFLIDFLNINTETLNNFKKIKKPKTLIISKLDIIPKSIKKEKLTEYLKNTYAITENVFYQSTKKNINTLAILKFEQELNIKNVYIVGYANSGKSTLINKINEVLGNKNNKITTSAVPNTTVDFIKIKVDEKINIIDSPGFVLESTLYSDDEYDLIERINGRNYLNPITYQTKDITSLIIEDKVRIDANSKNSFTIYISNALNIKRVFKDDDSLKNLDKYELKIDDNCDLVIKGVGFINIKKACKIAIYCDKDLFEVRNSCFNS